MKILLLALATLGIAAVPASGYAAPCRNAQGHFVKCATAAPRAAAPAAAPAAPAASTRTAAPRAARAATTRHAATGQRCRGANGQFAKCGTPGAHPA